MRQVKLKDVKFGEYFTLVSVEYPTERQVWVRGHYERSDKKYYSYKWADINHETAMRGDRLVFVDLIF